MWARILSVFFFVLTVISVSAQEKFNTVEDLRDTWKVFEEDVYRPIETGWYSGVNTIYFEVDARTQEGQLLLLESAHPFFVYVNGHVTGAYEGRAVFDLDSLARTTHAPVMLIALHQDGINPRDLRTEVVSRQAVAAVEEVPAVRHYWFFRDFAVLAGLAIIILFVFIHRLQPKLAADYLSVARIFSGREVDDGQPASRLTSSSNIQFYVLCSLLIGYYLLIVFENLPPEYGLPLRFQSEGFWSATGQWLKISALVFAVLATKILIIFLLTRLFGMRGVARFHFFNWIRVLLVVFGTATVFLFGYFVSRGSHGDVFVFFLSLVVVTLVTWIVVAFLKLGGRTGHSMFHLFSYLCATEIIPLLITAKVLFQ